MRRLQQFGRVRRGISPRPVRRQDSEPKKITPPFPVSSGWGVNCQLTDHLALMLGYQTMWIEGVAVLPAQLDDLAVPLLGDLDMSGSPFYHGANLGLRLDW